MNRSLRLLYFGNLIFSLGMGLYHSFIPLYLRSLGADTVVLGQYSAFGLIVSSLSYFPATWLCNRFDHKHLIIAGWLMCIPVPLLLALAPSWHLAFLASFIFYSSYFSNVALQSYVIRKAEPEHLSSAYAQVFSAYALGNVFSQSLGGFLLEQRGYLTVFLVAALLYIVATLIFTQIDSAPPEHTGPQPRGFNLQLPKKLWSLLLLFCFLQAVAMMPLDFVVPHLKDRSGLDTAWIGIIGSLASLAAAAGLPLLGKLADRIGITRTIGVNLILTAGSFALMITVPGSIGFVMLAALLRGSSRSGALYTMSLGSSCEPADLSNLLSLFGLLSGLLTAIGPMISGVLYSQNPDAPFTVALCLTLLSGLLMLRFRMGAMNNRT